MIRTPQLWVAWAPLIVVASSRKWAIQAASDGGTVPGFTCATRLRHLPPSESSPTLTPIDHSADFMTMRAIDEAFEYSEEELPNLADFVAHGFAPHLITAPPPSWLMLGLYGEQHGPRTPLKPKHRPRARGVQSAVQTPPPIAE